MQALATLKKSQIKEVFPKQNETFIKISKSCQFNKKRPNLNRLFTIMGTRNVQQIYCIVISCKHKVVLVDFFLWYQDLISLITRHYKLVVKGCARYIFACLFCVSKRQHFRIKKKCFFYFNSKALFILELMKFQLFRYSNAMTSSNA